MKAPAPKKSRGSLLLLAALLVVAGIFAWRYFAAVSPAPAAPLTKATPAPVVAPASDPAPTPSDTLNRLAHAPANAINQAQETIAAKRASGQARIDAAVLGEDVPDRPAVPPPAASSKKASSTANAGASVTTTTVGPGVSATTHVESASEASAPFRSFVANAKVTGVFQGSPPRVVINGKLTRMGEVVDAGLGITFDGIDSNRRHLLFKDKSGATVSRRF